MAVAQDAISTAAVDNTPVGGSFTGSINLTIGAGANFLTVRACWALNVSAVTMNWDSSGTNQAMTQIGAASNTTGLVRTELWGLKVPTAGLKNINITWTGGSTEILIVGESWTGVDQTTPTSSVQTSNNISLASNATLTLTAITSAIGNECVASFANDFTWASTNQTQEFITNGGTVGGAFNRAAGAASVTMSATNGATADNGCGVGCNLNAAAAAAGGGGFIQVRKPPLRNYRPGSKLFAGIQAYPAPAAAAPTIVSGTPRLLTGVGI